MKITTEFTTHLLTLADAHARFLVRISIFAYFTSGHLPSLPGAGPGGGTAIRNPWEFKDLKGFVWEWTRSLWGEKWNKPSFDYSYDPHDGREDEETPDAILRVLRGGAFNLNEDNVRCAFRDHTPPPLTFC